MRLAKLRVSGFKSFVDPTTLALPGNLTCVVGPNGCGKSNIIDAINWVMGESSARHLRGDTLADVIFNGSNTRKPVGQASVEMVFDNSDGTIGGQYAVYSEIAIKRVLARDGQSSYWLNGVRCRRKDITDMFLGTGLGSRSYSVIEQGTIGRVIEAKAEELRVFLEEAAGISRYKERRRETETRMRHARENLDRITDIREELGRQLSHLERQAKAAARYKELKTEERTLQGRLLTVRWRAIETERVERTALVQQQETRVEAETARLRAAENAAVQLRAEQQQAMEAFNVAQADFYRIAAEVSRCEQGIRHLEERRVQLAKDLTEAHSGAEEARSHLQHDERNHAELLAQLDALQPRSREAADAERNTFLAVDAVEAAMQQWQQDWEQFNAHAANARERERVEHTRIEHIEIDLEDAAARVEALRAERERLLPASVQASIANLERRLDIARREHTRLEQVRAARQGEAEQLRRALDDSTVALDLDRGEQRALVARVASLEALQRAAMSADIETLGQWLTEHGLAQAPRLARKVTVEDGWEVALEAALRIPLDALCVDGIDAHAQGQTPPGTLTLVESDASAAGLELAPESLAIKVQGPRAVLELLAGVRVADDLPGALRLRGTVQPGECIVTRAGAVVGAGWVRLPRADARSESVLARERELQSLIREVERVAGRIESRLAEIGVARERLAAVATDLGAEDGVRRARDEVASIESELAGLRTRLQHIEERGLQIDLEIDEIEARRASGRRAADSARAGLTAASASMAEVETRRVQLEAARERLRAELHAAREAWREARDGAHTVTLRVESLRSQAAQLARAVERHRELVVQLDERRASVEQAAAGLVAPLAALRVELDGYLSRRIEAESRLNGARAILDGLEDRVRGLEIERVAVEQDLGKERSALEQLRVEAHGLRVRAMDLEEQFQSAGFARAELLAELPAEANEESVRAEIEGVERRMARLGAINLAAIDEFTEINERKGYLDSQHADLSEALATLEEAIRKIDRETRTRFKETFDRVNTGLQQVFPVLFGGGHAYLELTGTDLLETGVTVMARPPGKRNSTIHLLSGGEKALTALALIVAIFELNPAPFCLMDEVDAPLDDTNVVRFCDLLKSMSGRVQFLCVTHNKITMEIADQLIGVTMQEPGVSRLVAVNMEEAVQMALSA